VTRGFPVQEKSRWAYPSCSLSLSSSFAEGSSLRSNTPHYNGVNVFKWCAKASRATSHLSSASVIWYTVLFRQKNTDRPAAIIKVEMTIATSLCWLMIPHSRDLDYHVFWLAP
jgi:hypothetical protein